MCSREQECADTAVRLSLLFRGLPCVSVQRRESGRERGNEKVEGERKQGKKAREEGEKSVRKREKESVLCRT